MKWVAVLPLTLCPGNPFLPAYPNLNCPPTKLNLDTSSLINYATQLFPSFSLLCSLDH